MNRHSSDSVSRFHDALIRRWGIADPRAVGYSGRLSQCARFDVVSDLCQGDATVLDAGCGTGDLYAHLRDLFGRIDYLGIDRHTGFIDHARRVYHDEPICAFRVGDIMEGPLPARDIVVACGSLNYHRDDKTAVLGVIDRLYDAAGRILIFNMLDAARMFPGEMIVGYDPEVILQHCFALSDRVSLVRGYLPYDFTVAMARAEMPVEGLDRLRRRGLDVRIVQA